jgi:hypothetical protein
MERLATRLAPVTLFLPLLADAPSAAPPQGPARQSSGWVETDGGLGWIASYVAFGEGGEEVFAYHDLNHTGAALFPAWNTSPPAAHWDIPSAAGDRAQPRGVAAARSADVYVAVVETEEPAGAAQRMLDVLRYSPGGKLEWSYRYPSPTDQPLLTSSSHVAVSDDGQIIVASAHDGWKDRNELLIFSPRDPAPQRSIALAPGIVWQLELSADGNVVALGIGATILVLETHSGAVRYELDTGVQITDSAMALSGNGSRLAYSRGTQAGDFVVLEWTGMSYDARHVIASPLSQGRFRALRLSTDGSTIAAGIARPYPSTVCAVEAYDAASGIVLTSEILVSVPGPEQYQNVVTDVAISADGERLAAALSGDEERGLPVEEIRVYTTGLDEPIFTRNLPGSALGIDISPDGRWVVVGSKSVHMNELGSGGRIDLIRLP